MKIKEFLPGQVYYSDSVYIVPVRKDRGAITAIMVQGIFSEQLLVKLKVSTVRGRQQVNPVHDVVITADDVADVVAMELFNAGLSEVDLKF